MAPGTVDLQHDFATRHCGCDWCIEGCWLQLKVRVKFSLLAVLVVVVTVLEKVVLLGQN